MSWRLCQGGVDAANGRHTFDEPILDRYRRELEILGVVRVERDPAGVRHAEDLLYPEHRRLHVGDLHDLLLLVLQPSIDSIQLVNARWKRVILCANKIALLGTKTSDRLVNLWVLLILSDNGIGT